MSQHLSSATRQAVSIDSVSSQCDMLLQGHLQELEGGVLPAHPQAAARAHAAPRPGDGLCGQ